MIIRVKNVWCKLPNKLRYWLSEFIDDVITIIFVDLDSIIAAFDASIFVKIANGVASLDTMMATGFMILKIMTKVVIIRLIIRWSRRAGVNWKNKKI